MWCKCRIQIKERRSRGKRWIVAETNVRRQGVRKKISTGCDGALDGRVCGITDRMNQLVGDFSLHIK